MSSTETRLVLIRHGESQAQVDTLVAGHDTCSGLSDKGRRQARALHDRLAATGELDDADAVYTSVLARAIETGTIIRPAIGGGRDIEVRPECAWCEIHPGEAEGLTWNQFRERIPPVGDGDDPFRVRVPGMETWAELYARVGARLVRAGDEHPGECVVIVGHGGTVAASFVALGNLPVRQGAAMAHQTINSSITEWVGDGHRWRLARFNDSAHLSGFGPQAGAVG